MKNPGRRATDTLEPAMYGTAFARLKIERDPVGIRLIVGRFQMVIGYLNRFAIWWHYRPLVNFYRG